MGRDKKGDSFIRNLMILESHKQFKSNEDIYKLEKLNLVPKLLWKKESTVLGSILPD